ncbi:MAG: oxidoreductase [Bradyrhizobium sp.]|nr:oxidoreductase [Bradyrhizobium sp.]
MRGRRAIVTGAARGIGAEVARGLAGAGARVVALDLRDDLGKALAQRSGGTIRYARCDVANKAQVDAAFADALGWLGGLDLLVHVAGLDKPGFAAEEISEDVWDLVMDVNAKGTFLTNQAACRAMRDGGGAIVNFGSFAGIRGIAERAAYSAAKGAVLAWTRAVAQAWGRYDITVNAIAPTMRTEVADKYLDRLDPEQRRQVDAERARITPMGGRLGEVERDLMPLILLLAGDGGRYITGQTFSVDGGRTMLGA